MSRIYIDNPVSRDFAMVPNAIWDLQCSVKAKALLAFLLSFRDGSMPTTKEIEAKLGIGKEARQVAMRELRRLGLVHWHKERNPKGEILVHMLKVSIRPILGDYHEPENPASGHHKPENPAAGKSGPPSLKIRPTQPENPAVPIKQNDKRRADARKLDPDKLTELQKSLIRADQTTMIESKIVKAGSSEMLLLQEALKNR